MVRRQKALQRGLLNGGFLWLGLVSGLLFQGVGKTNKKGIKVKKIAYVFLMVLNMATLSTAEAQSKNRLDLDDLMVKGEIHNDDRMMIFARQKNELKNYVKFRTSFKEEMFQELPVPQHITKF